MLAWDGSRLCLLTKWLENGAFIWPPVRDGAVTLNTMQLRRLFGGMDWARLGTAPGPGRIEAPAPATNSSETSVWFGTDWHGVRRRSSAAREPDTVIEMIVELRDENGRLRAMFETLRRTPFGAGADPGQMVLPLEDVSTATVEPKPEMAKSRPQDGRPGPAD